MFWIITALFAGYLAAIFTWPKVRDAAFSAKAAITLLRDKASALCAKLKTFMGS